MDIFFDYTSLIANQFIDPKKRIFIFYILISVGIAIFWFMIKKKLSFIKSIKKIFDYKIFFQSLQNQIIKFFW